MSTAALPPHKRNWFGVVLWSIAVAVSLWMTGQAVINAQRFADRPFDFDEAVHALPAYQIALDLRARPDTKKLEKIGERWRPHRGVAARLLWAYYRVVKEGRAGMALA
jgi:hypothetical protein